MTNKPTKQNQVRRLINNNSKIKSFNAPFVFIFILLFLISFFRAYYLKRNDSTFITMPIKLQFVWGTTHTHTQKNTSLRNCKSCKIARKFIVFMLKIFWFVAFFFISVWNFKEIWLALYFNKFHDSANKANR